MKKRLVIGNWKMYIDDPKVAENFATSLRRKVRGLPKVDVWIAPPTPFIATIAKVLQSSSVYVGAQKVTHHTDPKHTGSVSGAMVKRIGASFVIVGHSEYREEAGTNAKVRGQLERTVEAGLIPILCVGEREREENGDHFSFIEEELTSALSDFPKGTLSKLIVAYEPVWAIGEKAEEAMKPIELEEMTIFIRKILADILGRPTALRVPILYGGSVDETNAQALIREGGVSGFLVGRASTEVDSFVEILKLLR